MDEELKQELVAMASRDEAVRDALAASGELFDGYHSSMERVHVEHAERLAGIVAEYGWPGVERVEADGEAAAWLVLQHAISDPHLQREGLRRLKEAAERGRCPLASSRTAGGSGPFQRGSGPALRHPT